MRTFYKVLLFLFCFSAACTGLNDSGIFSMKLPVQNTVQTTQAQITDLSNSTSGPVGGLTVINFMVVFISSIMSGLMSLFTILPLLSSFGVPVWIGMMFQGPLWIIEAFGLYGLITGNYAED